MSCSVTIFFRIRPNCGEIKTTSWIWNVLIGCGHGCGYEPNAESVSERGKEGKKKKLTSSSTDGDFTVYARND